LGVRIYFREGIEQHDKEKKKAYRAGSFLAVGTEKVKES